jgi:benzoyl-CoA reductase/2-hydroxyglutaryl-CoA dehydratase subunit BcrC/BadD/HgdB
LGLEHKVAKMVGLIEQYEVDGFIMHSNRSCKTYSLNQYDLKKKVSEMTGKPGLIIEADHTDSRSYAANLIEKQIEAFVEMTKGR